MNNMIFHAKIFQIKNKFKQSIFKFTPAIWPSMDFHSVLNILMNKHLRRGAYFEI